MVSESRDISSVVLPDATGPTICEWSAQRVVSAHAKEGGKVTSATDHVQLPGLEPEREVLEHGRRLVPAEGRPLRLDQVRRELGSGLLARRFGLLGVGVRRVGLRRLRRLFGEDKEALQAFERRVRAEDEG